MITDKNFNLKLEQVHLNERKPKDLSDEDIKYLDFLRKSDEEFFEKFDVKKLSDSAIKKSKENIFQFNFKTVTKFAALAACLVIFINIVPQIYNGNKEIIYLKGDQDLNIYLKNNDSIEKLNNMDKVKSNSKLQITYLSNNRYGIICSLDGLHNLTFHYPEEIHSSYKLDVGKEVSLTSSYTLDNAPYFEKFYLITNDKEFNIDIVRKELNNIKLVSGTITKDLILPKNYKIKTITLLKE